MAEPISKANASTERTEHPRISTVHLPRNGEARYQHPPAPDRLTPSHPRDIFTCMASEETHVELLQGTLDLIVLRALSTMGPLHAYALATRLEQVADHPLSLNQGTLYPALVRLEQKGWIKGTWKKTENNRDAKYYALTKSGERALEQQAERWRRLAGLVDKLLLNES